VINHYYSLYQLDILSYLTRDLID